MLHAFTMRSRRSVSVRPGSLLASVWMSALLAVAVAASVLPAVDSTRNYALRGVVVDALRGQPASFAPVIDTVSRRGTMTDEYGRFLLTGLPVKVTIRIRAIGMAPLQETLELSPSDTLQRTFRLAGYGSDRFRAIRDSLMRIGRWPPTLDPDLLAGMREATDVRVFRLGPYPRVPADSLDPAHRIGPWPIVAEARKPARSMVQPLVETLRQTELYMARLHGAQKMCGGFRPGIDVRFTHHGTTTDVLLCYDCGEFAIWNDGRYRTGGDFEEHEPVFAKFAKRAFPDDPAFK